MSYREYSKLLRLYINQNYRTIHLIILLNCNVQKGVGLHENESSKRNTKLHIRHTKATE